MNRKTESICAPLYRAKRGAACLMTSSSTRWRAQRDMKCTEEGIEPTLAVRRTGF